MSTRSYIGLLQKNGKVKAIYCHFDGYLDGVGKTLLNHYTAIDKIKKLLSLGSISCLRSEVGEKHDFDIHTDNKLSKNWTLAYHRDRGESKKDTKPLIFDNVNDFLKDQCEDYTYLFQNNKWFYREWSETPLKLLETP
jgi:hypothetical protein